MNLRPEDRRRIEDEERLRIHTRERYARFEAQNQETQRQRDIQRQLSDFDKQAKNERFVLKHGGPVNAFKAVMIRWIIGGVVVALFELFSEIKDKGFAQSLTDAGFALFFICMIGVWRARRVTAGFR